MNTTPRTPLTKQLVLETATAIADRLGLDALTMRRLGAELGVEAMSLYNHVANKEAILDGMLELVVAEIEIPSKDAPWKDAMRRRATSAREVLTRHSWAIGLLESRGATGPSTVRYLDSILGNLRSAGFSIEDAAHAFVLLDSYVYGHVIQETSSSLNSAADSVAATTAGEYPHVAEVENHARTSGFTFDAEFEFGLDLILDGLARTAPAEPG